MNSVQRCKPYLGTYVEIQLSACMEENALLALSSLAFAEIARVEKLMSFHDPDSELSRINSQACQKVVGISPEMYEVLAQALALSEPSGGLFDVTIAPQLVHSGLLPDHGVIADELGCWQDIELEESSIRFKRQLQIDLGGIAKGYAVDRALAVLPEGVQGIINAGGDLRMTHWQDQEVVIRIPGQQYRVIEVPMQAPAVATSACYYTENGSAMVSPYSRQPVLDARSYSVFAPSCMLADALTKIVFLDPDNLSLLKTFGAGALVVDEAAAVYPLI